MTVALFDLFAGLANDQCVMGNDSQDEQPLMKIQHDWAEARIKGESFVKQGGQWKVVASRITQVLEK